MSTTDTSETLSETSEQGAEQKDLLSASADFTQAREVSASAVGRMLGLVTQAEMKVLEGKMDVIGTKITALQMKLDKLIQSATNLPSGSDLERIDVQIGSLKNLIKESLTGKSAGASNGPVTPPPAMSKDEMLSAVKKRSSVFVSSDAKPEEKK